MPVLMLPAGVCVALEPKVKPLQDNALLRRTSGERQLPELVVRQLGQPHGDGDGAVAARAGGVAAVAGLDELMVRIGDAHSGCKVALIGPGIREIKTNFIHGRSGRQESRIISRN